jgi:hypothetical protein
MNMKRKFIGFLFMVILAALTAMAFVGCDQTTQLSAPENINYDGTNLTWNEVEGTTKYHIQIDENQSYPIYGTSYQYKSSGSDFTVKLYAEATDSSHTDSETVQKTFYALGTVSNLRFDEEANLSWDVVDGATAYKIIIDGADDNITTSVASYSGLPQGQHSVQVKAIVAGNSSYYSTASSAKSYNILGVVDKDSITYSDGTISWKGVTGATAYEVAVDGTVVASSNKTTSLQYDSSNTNFSVTVKALGDGTAKFSGETSDSKAFVYLETITKFDVEDGIMTWDEVAGATGYKIKINGTVRETVTEPTYSKLSANSTIRIQIMPISTDTTYFSDWSAEESVLLLNAPTLQWQDDVELDGDAKNALTWNLVSNAVGYTVRLTKPDSTVTSASLGDTMFYGYDFLEVGTYTIEVQANADKTASNIYDSVYSTPIKVTRLASPKLASNNYLTSDSTDITKGFTVTFEKVTGASGYKIYKDGSELQNTTSNQFAVKDIIANNITSEQTFNYTIRSMGSVKTTNGVKNVTLSSLSSSAVSFNVTVLAAPQDPDMEGYIYSYGSVNKSTGYVINVAGDSYVSGNLTYDLSILEAGSYEVKVCAKGNGTDVLPSNYSTPINIKRLEAPYNIKIDSTDSAEGQLTYASSSEAKGYSIVFNNDKNAVDATTIDNINRYITEQGTAIYMVSDANYFNDLRTVYYMTSRASETITFIKLAAPTFGTGSSRFTNTQFIWNAPNNVNTKYYTPTYRIYNENKQTYPGYENGTTLDISKFEGGETYTFYVKAIGNGSDTGNVRYLNSELSTPVYITKLETPTVTRENGQYVWNGVPDAQSYVLYIDGKVMYTSSRTDENVYRYTPTTFISEKYYSVQVQAIGDNGNDSIDSNTFDIKQYARLLSTPDFSYSYSDESFNLEGTININITQTSDYAKGYMYTIGSTGSGGVSEAAGESYSYNPHSTGTFTISVYALGGNFDDDGVYYFDSQARGGNSTKQITLLAAPTESTIELSVDGVLSWSAVANAYGYEICYSLDGGATFSESETTTSRKLNLSKLTADQRKNIVIKIRTLGNGTNTITSEWVTRQK